MKQTQLLCGVMIFHLTCIALHWEWRENKGRVWIIPLSTHTHSHTHTHTHTHNTHTNTQREIDTGNGERISEHCSTGLRHNSLREFSSHLLLIDPYVCLWEANRCTVRGSSEPHTRPWRKRQPGASHSTLEKGSRGFVSLWSPKDAQSFLKPHAAAMKEKKGCEC